ncbi:MAG: hypothetical protein MJE66_15495 [Proteobacteria bacterium]|nr:hypothetical protein [Pseudomonadota bacterium]
MNSLREALLEIGAWCVTAPPDGPSPLDYALVSAGGLLVAFAFAKAVRHTLFPGETERSHIKWRVLEDEERE